jgi:hypothetical protein
VRILLRVHILHFSHLAKWQTYYFGLLTVLLLSTCGFAWELSLEHI